MIPITKPFFPPLEEYTAYLQRVWESGWFTNKGPLASQLEHDLCQRFDVPHFIFMGNGTIALQIAMRALECEGEVITTPFSYVATTSSIVWEQCTPVFVDIDPDTLNIDPARIESAITERTSAIIATHVYGNPCDIRAIRKIADRHGLKIIYDAAHAFGSEIWGKSVFEYGDLSATSFHATKLFHTVEGGGVFTTSEELRRRMDFMRNFGHNGPHNFAGVGINGKNSEVHAAMGLLNLSYVDMILENRKHQSLLYDQLLAGTELKRPVIHPDAKFNFSYHAVVLPTESVTEQVIDALNAEDIYPRRYFYPPLHELPYIEKAPSLDNVESISPRTLCLPMYVGLSDNEIARISDIITKAL